MTYENACEMIERFDSVTYEHCERVAKASQMLAKEIGMNKEQQTLISRGAMLHDIGKIGVPEEILNKHGPMTLEERLEMQNHVTYGEQILSWLDDCRAEYLDIARDHHAFLDPNAGGYRGVGADHKEPPALAARIVAIADVYDALSNDRPYKEAFPHDKVMEIMQENVEKGQFDPALYEIFKERIIPALEAEKELDPITERDMENYYGRDIGKNGFLESVEKRPMSAVEEDRAEKCYHKDIGHNGAIDTWNMIMDTARHVTPAKAVSAEREEVPCI